ANSFLTLGEAPTNNFSLTGTDTAGDITNTYTGNIKFNSDKVLSYVFDEMETRDLGVLNYVERYTWTLTTYTPGTGTAPGNGSSIPGFQLIFIIGAITVGSIFILKKYKFFKAR
ncbi:MAG: Loki-CTERM sorting domain-containing protein, partial [Promethearchaeota archaeon]